MTDYEEISIIVRQVCGLLLRADKIQKDGLNLSDQKIKIGVEGGIYSDFLKIVENVKK